MEKDDWIQNKMQEVISSQASNTHRHSASSQLSKFHIDNGFLKHKGRIVLSPSTTWKLKVLEEHHTTPTTGHQGVLKTYQRVKRSIYWLGMKLNIKKFVFACVIFQQNKYETIAPLQPLPIPQQIWASVSMDFIVGLANSKGKTVIMVVIDRLSKFAHFVALSHPYNATSVAQLFVDHVFKLHGMPTNIVSD